jgi:hypothetical protein
MRARRLAPSTSHPGEIMRLTGPSRPLRSRVARGIHQTSANQLQALHLMWSAFMGWSAHSPVDYDPTGDRRPEPGSRIRRIRIATGSKDEAALDKRASVALPPEVSIPDMATLGGTPAAIHHAQHQSSSALRPAATAHDPPPAIRKRVVLLPHAQTEPTDTRPNDRRAERDNGMNHSCSLQPTAPSAGTTTAIAQWHDAELAMKVARHSFDRWLTAGHDNTPSLALMHAYHTHTALHEAARSITMLIETFRAEANALLTAPRPGTHIPTQSG